jgi:hypothetical protein
MPTYVLICKDKNSISTKEVKVTASSQEEAKRMVEGRGQKLISVKNIIS